MKPLVLACESMSTPMPTVKLENLTKRFDDIIALDGINLDIHDQEFFVLLGQTGAGKTTTLRCIAGIGPARKRRNLPR